MVQKCFYSYFFTAVLILPRYVKVYFKTLDKSTCHDTSELSAEQSFGMFINNCKMTQIQIFLSLQDKRYGYSSCSHITDDYNPSFCFSFLPLQNLLFYL